MPKLTDTQSLILSRAATRPGNLAMPLPDGLHGAAAKKAVAAMISRGWLEEVDADLRKGEPLWRETGDGHGTTLVATGAGLEAIGIEPVVAKATSAPRKATPAPRADAPTARCPKARRYPHRHETGLSRSSRCCSAPRGRPSPRSLEATGWQAHSAAWA